MTKHMNVFDCYKRFGSGAKMDKINMSLIIELPVNVTEF